MISIRCVCGADAVLEATDRVKQEGITCWNCGRVWRLSENGAETSIKSGPVKTPIPIGEGGK